MLPLGSLRLWMMLAIVPIALMSSALGLSIFASFCVDRKIFLLWDRACSTAVRELFRPTTNGIMVWGKTTTSRRGTIGSVSRLSFLKLVCVILVIYLEGCLLYTSPSPTR